MSDSDDDDDDPFSNKSIGFSPNRTKLNATPTSTIKADSIAGKSRASGGAAAVNTPGGKNQAGQAAPNAEQEFRENVGGVSEFETKLKELWNKRTQLMKTKKKKKKKKNRGGLKRSGTKAFDTGSGYDDDKTSFMTMTVVD